MELRVNEQLLLRSYELSDAPELFKRVAENRAHLRTFLPWVDVTLNEVDSKNFVELTIRQAGQQEALALGIFKEDELIGGIGMHDWNHHLKKCQIGYWLVEAEQGKGQMIQCAQTFITFLFAKLDMNKVEIQFLPFNTRSGALAAQLGAKVEGVIRHNYRLHGFYEDTVIAGILKKEWKS